MLLLFIQYERVAMTRKVIKETKYCKIINQGKVGDGEYTLSNDKMIKTIVDNVNEEVPYELTKSVLENFSKVLTESSTREQQKNLLHMIISEITINELREIDSIKIKLDDSLINYLSNEEGVSMKGTPSSFMLRNVGINTVNLDIAI